MYLMEIKQSSKQAIRPRLRTDLGIFRVIFDRCHVMAIRVADKCCTQGQNSSLRTCQSSIIAAS